MICFCGHNCGRCFVYLGKIPEAREFYLRQFGVDVPEEKLRCKGGRSKEVFYLCEDCPFRKCSKNRGLNSCTECPEPCAEFLDYQNKYVNRCGQL